MTVESNYVIAIATLTDWLKVIPQYCTAHPVLRIITRNKIYNGGFPRRKARTREKWSFQKAWLGKRGGNLWQRRKRQLSESLEIVECAKTSFLSRTWRNILNQGETSTGAMVLSS